MAIVSLLRLPTTPRERWAFIFEHDQAHRRKTRKPTSYVLDPMQNEGLPTSKWHLDHQQAHNQMNASLPGSIGQILSDSNLRNINQKTWWQFANHNEHYIDQ